MVRYELGLIEARKRKLSADPIIAERINQEIYKGLIEKEIGGRVTKIKVTEPEMKKFYRRNPEIRKGLEREAEGKGPDFLYERLKQADPAVTSWIHPNDRQRIIRALEVFEATGKKMSQWQQEHGFKESPFETLKIGLNRDRAELYDLIDRRCDKMIADGLVNEVKGLLDKGYSLDLKALQSVGYRHVGLYLSGSKSLEEAVQLMKRDTRHLAKRQLTWFRSDKEIRWFHPEKERERILSAVKEFLG